MYMRRRVLQKQAPLSGCCVEKLRADAAVAEASAPPFHTSVTDSPISCEYFESSNSSSPSRARPAGQWVARPRGELAASSGRTGLDTEAED
eukprot:scaffold7381_cov310-Pinguiococcus_pyrenoidosus.AAC.109